MPLLILLVASLHLCSLHTAASSPAIMEALSPGQSLAAGDKLVSDNGKFALGFFQLAASSKPSRNWHLGIWFNKVPKLTPVWVANRETPLPDPTSSELTFSGDGNVILLNRATNSTVWSSQANATAAAANNNSTVLILLDTGNLVLRSSSSSGVLLWQSFDHPTDTLLPNATIGLDKLTGRTRRLVSRKNRVDQSPGAYSMELGLAGVVQLLWKNASSVPYWSSGEWNGQYFSSVPGMTARHLFDFTFVDDEREVSFAYHLLDDTITMYSFLDVSGQRKVLTWHQSTHDWVTVYTHPTSQCEALAVCGPFAACNDNALPLCSCLKGFSVASPDDWDLDDRTAGCKRDTPLDCGGKDSVAAGVTDKFYAVPTVRLPYDPHGAGGTVASSAAECAQACLSNCSCTAYSFGGGVCSVWHGELLNVEQQQSNDATAGKGWILYLRLAAKEFETRKNNRGVIIGGVIVIGASITALGVLVLFMLLMAKRKRNRRCQTMNSIRGDSGLVAFRYSDLLRATNNFSDKIGAGGFGSVFKGLLNESIAIAVKRLNGSYQVEKQFRAEVSSIGVIHHTNLVKMVGFCCERDKRLLVYEHMPNLSLDVHLFRNNAATLNWNTRYQIALGVARGLAYLHESCRDCIIHCDIKPQNILLDASFVPKIADFRMAKLLQRDFSRVLTTTRGTIGYLAPEWISGMPITTKVDVYSYGMVLLEIISGSMNAREECCSDDIDDVVYFPVQVARKLLEGDVLSLLDRRLNGDAVFEDVERACKVACWCIQDNETDRPTMGKVVQILEGLIELEMPPMSRLLAAISGRSHSASA